MAKTAFSDSPINGNRLSYDYFKKLSTSEKGKTNKDQIIYRQPETLAVF
jgi:hypothetical protein